MSEKEEEQKIQVSTTSEAAEKAETATLTLIEKAEQVAERIERANAKTEELVRRNEATAAQNRLGGQSEAGAQPEKKKEISDEEYAEMAISGKLNG